MALKSLVPFNVSLTTEKELSEERRDKSDVDLFRLTLLENELPYNRKNYMDCSLRE